MSPKTRLTSTVQKVDELKLKKKKVKNRYLINRSINQENLRELFTWA